MQSQPFLPRQFPCLFFVGFFLSVEMYCAFAENESYQDIHDLVAHAAAPRTHAEALAKLVREGTTALQPLVEVYGREPELQIPAAEAILRIANETPSESAAAIPVLKKLLENAQSSLRVPAIQTLGAMGYVARSALPALADALSATEQRDTAAVSVALIAESLQDNAQQLRLTDLRVAARDIQNAAMIARTEILPTANGYGYVLRIRRCADYLELLSDAKHGQLSPRLPRFLQSHPVWCTLGALLGFWYLLVALLLLLFPVGALELHNRLALLWERLELYKRLAPITTPIRFVLIPSSWVCRPWVLDAWVKKHGDQVRENLECIAKRDQQDNRIHLPVRVDNNRQTQLEVTDFQDAFKRKSVLILIHGESGVGKTNLAYQFARWCNLDKPEQRLCRSHRMLPVLLRINSPPPGQDAKPCTAKPGQWLIEMVRGQLRVLAGLHRALPGEVVKQLLLKRRLLVIVDGLFDPSTRPNAEIQPQHPDFPANAFLATSRSENALLGTQQITLEPIRLSPYNIRFFVNEHIQLRGRKHLFKADRAVTKYCRKLSAIAHNKPITVFLAKLYVEQIIEIEQQVQNGIIDDVSKWKRLPNNIPDLISSYLNYLNRNAVAPMPDNFTVHRAAKLIASVCIDGKFVTGTVPRDRMPEALGGDTELLVVEHLERRLRLLTAECDALRFSLDPLAEYLAAICLVEKNKDVEEKWKELLSKAGRNKTQGGDINGFLSALLDCCESNPPKMKVPEFVVVSLRALCIPVNSPC